MAKTIEDVKKLKEQYEAARSAAIADIRAKIKELEEELEQLGANSPRITTGRERRESSPRVCSVCGEAGHNKRGHDAWAKETPEGIAWSKKKSGEPKLVKP